MSARFSFEHVKRELENSGLILLSNSYVNSRTKVKVQCIKCNYIYETKFCVVLSGSKCPDCAGNRKYSEDEIKEMILKKGGILLSKWKNTKNKVKIECLDCKNIWETYFSAIRSGSWCRECHLNKIRINIKQIKNEINDKGGILLSDSYKNNLQLLDIKCNLCKNIFKINYANFKCGKWCPTCAIDKTKNSLDYVKQVIESRNGILLGSYENNNSRLDILCLDCNNSFKMIFRNVVSGYWCQACSKRKTQRKIFNIICDIIKCDGEINYRGFEWLINSKTGSRQELDNWFPKLKLAVEYDGEQHFKPVRFGGMTKSQAEKAFKHTKYLDKNKNMLIKQHKDEIKYFIRFSYKEIKLLNKEYIRNKLIENGVIEC